MFCDLHEIQTFVLLIVTNANLVPVSYRENLVRETDLNPWGCLGGCLIFVPVEALEP